MERDVGVVTEMARYLTSEIMPRKHITIDNNNRIVRFAPQSRAGVTNCSPSAERFRLVDVAEFNAQRASVTEVIDEDLRPIRRGQDYVANAGLAQVRDLVSKKGTPATGSIGLGVVTVSGRSRVPCPPTSSTASSMATAYEYQPTTRRDTSASAPGRPDPDATAGTHWHHDEVPRNPSFAICDQRNRRLRGASRGHAE